MDATVEVRVLPKNQWEQAKKLSVFDHQLKEVATVSEALFLVVNSAPDKPNIPIGIFADGQLIGFSLILCDLKSDKNFWITRFFIDKQHQRKGYGLSAVAKMIVLLKTFFPNAKQINLCVSPENVGARALYLKCGFKEAPGWIINGDSVWSRAT